MMQMTFTGERYVPQLRGQIYYEHLHRYALALTLARDKDVLDIASGEGYGSALLAMVARSVTGVDVDDASVRFASSRYTAMNLNFRTGSAAQIPVADASVDLVVSFETIEHLREHERMLGEFRRVLRPGGRVIISSPNKLVYSDARGYSNPFHVRELYFHEFRDILRDFFPEIRLFGHRIFAGSAVYGLNATSQKTTWLGPSAVPESGISPLSDPEYFIAVCGVEAGAELPDLCSVYLDPRDDLLDDVRSGGLAAADAMAPMISAKLSPEALGREGETLSLSSGSDDAPVFDVRASDDEVYRERIYGLERLRSEQYDRATGFETRIAELEAQLADERRRNRAEIEREARHEAEREAQNEAKRETNEKLKADEERNGADLRKVLRRDAELRLTVDSLREEVGDVRKACYERDVQAHAMRARIQESAALTDELVVRLVELQNANALLQDDRDRLKLVAESNLVAIVLLDRERIAQILRGCELRLSEVSDKSAEFAVLERALFDSEARVRDAEARSLASDEAINAIVSSRSWAVTKPIRRAVSVFSNRP